MSIRLTKTTISFWKQERIHSNRRYKNTLIKGQQLLLARGRTNNICRARKYNICVIFHLLGTMCFTFTLLTKSRNEWSYKN